MGAMLRATKREIEQLAQDPAWWPGICAHIANKGKITDILRDNAWAWGGLWAWIQSDEERMAEYDAALKARAQIMAFESVDEIDDATMADVPLRKFKFEAKLKVAGKWDRGRYGENAEVRHSGAIGMNLMAVLASLPRAGTDTAIAEKDVTPVAADAPTDAQLANTLKSAFKAEYVVDEI